MESLIFWRKKQDAFDRAGLKPALKALESFLDAQGAEEPQRWRLLPTKRLQDKCINHSRRADRLDESTLERESLHAAARLLMLITRQMEDRSPLLVALAALKAKKIDTDKAIRECEDLVRLASESDCEDSRDELLNRAYSLERDFTYSGEVVSRYAESFTP